MTTFNPNSIGKKISKLRKEHNLTQAELADKLYVSYQAVSNWERGESMPDIAKLKDLSIIFDVTIDELLEHKKVSKVVQNIIDEEPVDITILTEDELKDLLPMVKPKQFGKSFQDFEDIPFELFIIMAPFLDEKDIDQWVIRKVESESEVKWAALIPFMSQNAVDVTFEVLIKKEKSSIGWIGAFSPFVSSKKLNEFIVNIYESKGLSSAVVLAPFVDSIYIDQVIEVAIKKGNYQDVVAFMPFASDKSNLKNFVNIF